MRRVGISDGYTVLIDSEDAELIAGFNWRPLRLDKGKVYAHAWRGDLHLYMHRLIMGFPADREVDHINGDGLDNRKDNLRPATHSQNLANTGKPRLSRQPTSRFKGVCWDKSRGKWTVFIGTGRTAQTGKRRSLGRFDDETAAARAYDAAAFQQWGEFARLNFERKEVA